MQKLGKVALFVLLPLAFALLLALSLRPADPWPLSGQVKALQSMSLAVRSHECNAKMEVWSNGYEPDSVYMFRKENDICRTSYRHRGWADEEGSVTAFFRCDLGEQFAEYAITIFKDTNHPLGPYWCDYVIKPKIEDFGVGMNFDVQSSIHVRIISDPVVRPDVYDVDSVEPKYR